MLSLIRLGLSLGFNGTATGGGSDPYVVTGYVVEGYVE